MVLDTHVLLWWLGTPKQLSAAARRALRAASAKSPVIVSAVSAFEIAAAVRRKRLALSTPVGQWLADAMSLPELVFESVTPQIAEMATPQIAEMAGSFGDEIHGDPGDRLIAATALALSLPLVTADARLRAVAGLRTVW